MDEQVNQDVAVTPAGQPEQVSKPELGQEVAKPIEPTEVKEGQVTATQPEPVLTEQKILQLVKQASKEAAEETLRQMQSRTDKAEAKFRKEVQDRIDQLKSIGVNLSQEQADQLANQTRKMIEPPPANPVELARNELESEYQVELLNSDLEAKLVKTDGSEYQFLRTYEKALQAKKDRLSSASKPPAKQQEKLEEPQARMSTSPNKGVSGLATSDPDKLFDMAYRRKD